MKFVGVITVSLSAVMLAGGVMKQFIKDFEPKNEKKEIER